MTDLFKKLKEWGPVILFPLPFLMKWAMSDNTPTIFLQGKSLGIMGMTQAGKTQLLTNLQGKPYPKYEQTGTEKYESFELSVGGKKFEVVSGTDIGGGEYNIELYYEKFLKKKDICMFLFDVQKYKDDIEYRKRTNARLDFINQHVNKWPEGCAIIGTHVDKVKIKDGENIIAILQQLIAGKPYARLFNYNLFAYNLTDPRDIDKLKQKLFIEK